jgi:hypothetical protein
VIERVGDAGGFVEDEQVGGEAADGVGGGGQGDDFAAVGEAEGKRDVWDGRGFDGDGLEKGAEAAE